MKKLLFVSLLLIGYSHGMEKINIKPDNTHAAVTWLAALAGYGVGQTTGIIVGGCTSLPVTLAAGAGYAAYKAYPYLSTAAKIALTYTIFNKVSHE